MRITLCCYCLCKYHYKNIILKDLIFKKLIYITLFESQAIKNENRNINDFSVILLI